MHLVAAALAILALARCDTGTEADRATGSVATLTVWFHSGQPGERETIEAQVSRFNASQQDVRVQLTILPERSYNAQVQSAAVAGELPDLLEFDGPYLYRYVWQGELVPLDDLLDPEIRADLLPTIVAQGTFAGKLYSVGTFDSGLALYARRSRLEEVGVRIPASPAAAWTVEEFEAALAALARADGDGAVLDLKLNYPGEWLTYAFSPVIQSAGGDLIERDRHQSASGVLNGPAARKALRHVQTWFEKGFVDPNVDDAAFTGGRVTLSWVGHWEFSRYDAHVGNDLALVPLPDFGTGTKTGQGSWNWGVTTSCRQPEQAVRFLEFLLRPEEVLAMANANGAVPATRAAIGRSPLYGKGGPLRLFVDQLAGGFAVPRPRTPAYPVITSAFQRAFLDIRHGTDVGAALDKAVAAIDRDIEDNRGYPFGG
jgi:multiple sugar transport system substrate-binding protein